MAPTRPGPRGVLLTALVLLSMSVIPAIAQPRVGVPGAPLPFDPAVLHGNLHNGMQYYIVRNAEPAGQAKVLLAVRAGSVFEEDDQRGFARFVARMAFRSTARFSEQQIADYLASIGVAEVPGQSVQTGFDASVLHLDIPTGSPDALQTGIEMLGEWAFAITFPPDAVERERALILDSSGSDGGIDDGQLAALFGGSRYADRQPAGLREVVEHATPEQLAAFHERWYQPDLMAFIAVGDFDPEAVESAMREHLAPAAQGADGDAGARRRDRTGWPAFAIPDHPEPRVSLLADADAGAAHLTLYRKLEADTGADLPAYRKLLVQRLIAAMINARLAARQQADQPFLSAAVGRNRLTREVDVAIATAQAEPGAVERGLSALLAELRRVQVHGFSDAEVAREKAALTRSVEDAYETRDRRPSHVLAEEYLRHFLEAGPYPGIDRERELHRLLLPEITLEELHQWAFRNMPSGSSANTVLLVTEPAHDDPAARETLLRDQLIAAAALEVEPYAGTVAGGGAAPLLAVPPTGGSIAAERHVLEIDAQRWTLSNGITVIAKQTALGDEVLFHASSPGGSSLVADADFVPALTSATVIAGSGAGPHDRGALDELLADKQVTVTPYIAELFEGFSGSAAPQDLETLFQLIYLYATRPRVDGRFYAQYESQLRAQAEQRESRPEAAFSDTLRIALSQGHFRARPVTPAILEELDLERAVQVFADRFADFSDCTFLFVGAFDWQELRSLAETYLAALPAGARQEQWRDVGIDPPPGIEEHAVRAGSPARAVTRMVFAGDMRWNRGEALALAAVGEVLKLRLGERLPGVGGGVGSIGVSSDSQLIPDPEYRVIVGFDSVASRADEARDAVLAEVAWLRRGGERVALEGALAEAKKKLRAAREQQVVHNRFWLDQLLTAVRNEEPLSEVARFPERLEALKAEQLVAAARRYLTPDRYVRVVLLPEQDTP